MARILETPPPAWTVWLLFALATLSGLFGDFDAPTLRDVTKQQQSLNVALIVAGVFVGVLVVVTVLLWLFAWVPLFIGRFLGGTGQIREVRAATAWGLAPAIWALLYRVPVALSLWGARDGVVPLRDGNVGFDPGQIAAGCGTGLVILLLELTVFAWCVAISSSTLAEAHKFSAWHGLGTILLAALTPFVVILAAVLAVF